MMRRLDQSGFSLIQVLVAAGIMSMTVMAFLAMQSVQSKSNVSTQTLISRNLLQLQIQQALVNPGAIMKSMADTSSGNVELKKCLVPTGNSCTQTSAPAGFVLIDAQGTRISGGSPSDPARYDHTGAPCSSAGSRCLLEVYTEYQATCRNGTSPCSNADVLAKYTIRQAPGVTAIGGTPLAPYTSPQITLSAIGTGGTVSGECGSANGSSFQTPPTVNLCAAGATQGAVGTGPWTWICYGMNGGVSVSCSATKVVNDFTHLCAGEDQWCYAPAGFTVKIPCSGQTAIVPPSGRICCNVWADHAYGCNAEGGGTPFGGDLCYGTPKTCYY